MILLIASVSFVALSLGSWIVKFWPSNFQPSISFVVFQYPSSCFNFLIEIGSPPLCPVIFGGGNIEWMP